MDFYSMPTEEEVMQVREITLKERRIDARASEEEVQQMAAEMAAEARREIEEDHLKSLREAMQEYMRSLAARQTADADPAEETEPAPYQYTIF